MLNLADRVSELSDDNLRLQTIIEEQRVQLKLLLKESEEEKARIRELEDKLATVLNPNWGIENGK